MNQREPDSVKVAEELFAHEELTGGTIPAGNAPAETDAGREAVRRELLELDQALKLAVPALPDQEKEQALVERVMAAAACFCFLFFAPGTTKERPILIINALGDGAMRGEADDWASACGQAVLNELSQHRHGVTLTQTPAEQLSPADLAKRHPQSAVLLILEPGAADNTLSVNVYDARSNRILQQKILTVTPQDWRDVSRQITALVQQALPDK